MKKIIKKMLQILTFTDLCLRLQDIWAQLTCFQSQNQIKEKHAICLEILQMVMTID